LDPYPNLHSFPNPYPDLNTDSYPNLYPDPNSNFHSDPYPTPSPSDPYSDSNASPTL
jgi:hypothetical protein